MKYHGLKQPFPGMPEQVEGRNNSSWANINQPWLPPMTFTNCNTAIRAIRYAGKIENCDISESDSGVEWERSPLRDVRIRDNVIETRQFGVSSFLNEPLNAVSSISDNQVRVSNTGAGANPAVALKINEGGYGTILGSGWSITGNQISTENGGRGLVYRNGIFGKLSSNAINNENPALAYMGIQTEGVAFSAVELNNITQNSIGAAFTYGIHSDGGWSNSITCNCLDKTGVGAQFYDLADLSNRVKGNHFNNHGETGLRLGDPVAGNAFIGKQFHTGNDWDLAAIPPGGFGGVNWGVNQNVIELSEFTVDPIENGGIYNPAVSPGSGWFVEDPDSIPTYQCSDPCAPAVVPSSGHEGESPTPTDLDLAIAGDGLPTNGFDQEMSWKARYRLYRKILRQPNMDTIPVMADFISLYENQSEGKLAWVAEQRALLFALGESDLAQYDALRNQMDSLAGNLITLDNQMQSGTQVDSASYHNLLDSRASIETQMESFLDSVTQTQTQNIQDLILYNNNITTSLTPAANQKSVNHIALRLLETDTLGAGDLDILRLIAAQCPQEGGDAVYEARALVHHFSGETYDNSACEVEERDQKAVANSFSNIRIYPNPASDALRLEGVEAGSTLELYSMEGRLLRTLEIVQPVVSLHDLKSGIYLVRVKNPVGELIHHQKLVVAL